MTGFNRTGLLVLVALLCGSVVHGLRAVANEQGGWTPSSDMPAQSAGHSATVLTGPNCGRNCGKVLVVGGRSAFMYDPNTRQWATAGGTNLSHNNGHTATLLSDGRVLVVGGSSLPVADMFDPAAGDSGAWTPVAPMAHSRTGHTATLLKGPRCGSYCGSVLVAGGDTGRVGFVELFDPSQKVWIQLASMGTPRTGHTANLLAGPACGAHCGKILVTGGFGGFGTGPLASSEFFDPSAVNGNTGLAGAWSQAPAMCLGRVTHTASLLRDGSVLVVGGVANQSTGAPFGFAELFDPRGGPACGEAWSHAGTLANPRLDHTATTLLNGKVLIAGGYKREGPVTVPLNSVEVFTPASGVEQPQWRTAASMTGARYQHAAALISGGDVLVTGGWGKADVLKSSELFQQSVQASLPVPTIDRLEPAHAPSWGDTEVVIRGAGFTGASSVSISSPLRPSVRTPVKNFSVDSDSEITVVVPDHEPGPVYLKVENAGTHSSPGPPSRLVYLQSGGAAASRASVPRVTQEELSAPGIITGAEGSEDKRAVLLTSGKPLLTGRGYSSGSGRRVDIYHPGAQDPSTGLAGKWESCPLPKQPNADCPGWMALDGGTHTTTSLIGPGCASNCGNVLATHGETAEIYDAAQGTWRMTRSLSVARSLPGTAVLTGTGCGSNCGKVLIAGEEENVARTLTRSLAGAQSLTTQPRSSAELFDPASETWRTIRSLLSAARRGHTVSVIMGSRCSPHCGKVLVSGGDTKGTAELFDPVTERWNSAGDLAGPRFGHTATVLPTGEVLLLGGCRQPPTPAGLCTHPNEAIGLAEVFDPSKGSWEVAGSLLFPRFKHSATLLPNGRVLIAGGVTGYRPAGSPPAAKPVLEVEEYAPFGTAGDFSIVARLSEPTWSHTATALPTGPMLVCGRNCGRVLIAGGHSPPSRNHFAALLTPQPEIIAFSEGAAPPEGGKALTLTGTGLASASAVTVDGTSVPFRLHPDAPDTTMAMLAPPHPVGSAEVVVFTSPDDSTVLRSKPLRLLYASHSDSQSTTVEFPFESSAFANEVTNGIPARMPDRALAPPLTPGSPSLSSSISNRTPAETGLQSGPVPFSRDVLILDSDLSKSTGSSKGVKKLPPKVSNPGFAWVIRRAFMVFAALMFVAGTIVAGTRIFQRRGHATD